MLKRKKCLMKSGNNKYGNKEVGDIAEKSTARNLSKN